MSEQTERALDLIAYERAPRYPDKQVNLRVVCADGYTLSVQASARHYANDSGPEDDPAPYWRDFMGADIHYPFTTFEVGAVTSKPKPKKVWREYDSGGVWAWVPRQVVADLLDSHGGVVGWENVHEKRASAAPRRGSRV